MKALVIAPQPFFTPRGTPFSVYYRTLVTTQLGVDVDLLTYGQGQDVDFPGVRIVRIPNLSFLGAVKVGPSYLKLFLDLLLAVYAVGLLLRNRYDFVHAHEEAVFFCSFLKPLFRFKLVYDMHSSLPQQLTNFRFTKSRVLIGAFRRLEDRALRSADAVITICPDLAQYVQGRIADPEKHVLIENSIFDPVRLRNGGSPSGSTGDGPDPEVDEVLRRRPCVVYAGTLEPYQGIELLIRAFPAVATARPDAFLLIAGGNPEQVAHYRLLAERIGVSAHVRLTGQLPPDRARELCRRAAVLVSPRSEGTNTPGKVYEQLASGIPLVATDIFSHTQVLDDDVALLVAPEPRAIAEGILEALRPDGRGARVAQRARRLYEERYSRTAYEDRMRALLGFLGFEAVNESWRADRSARCA